MKGTCVFEYLFLLEVVVVNTGAVALLVIQ